VDHLPADVTILAELSVVVSMLSVALETTHGHSRATLRDVRLMGAALLANLIIVPVLDVLLARWLDLPLEMRTGFLRLAPGGLFALPCARVSQDNRVVAVGLLVVLTMVAVVVTPGLIGLCLPLAQAGTMPFVWLLLLVLLLAAAPLLVGRVWQQWAPAAAPQLGRLLGVLSIGIFILAALTAGTYTMPTLTSMGMDEIVAMMVLILCAWVVGWLLGGLAISHRKVLAISTSMRHAGGCFPIAAPYFHGTDVVVPIRAFSGMAIPMTRLCAPLTGRLRHDTEVRARPVEA